MRFWEVVIVGSSVPALIWTVVTGRNRTPWGHLLTAVAGAAVYAHLRFEGWRWQMIPLYAFVAIMVVVAIWDLIVPAHDAYGTRPSRLKSVGPTLSGLLALAAATALPLALPIPDLPAPSAPVGTVSLHLVDDSRIELYGPAPGGPRRLAVQIWYPVADPGDARLALWVEDVESFGPAAAAYLALPSFALDHLRYATSRSYEAAPVLAGRYPVVIYSHGWAGYRSVAFTEAEALAAAGYVVVAPDHTYGALFTTFADGTPARLDPGALPDEGEVSPEEYAAASRQLVDTYADDLRFVIDLLGDIDNGTLATEGVDLSGKLDLERLGLWGHSTGGGAAFEVCASDTRCDAVLGLDPWVEPVDDRLILQGLPVPSAAIRSEEWTTKPNDARLVELWGNSAVAEPLRCLTGTVHRDFSVLPYVSPVADYLGLAGPLGALRTDELVNEHLLAFFGEHLMGSGPAWDRIQPPEVTGCG
ncbi:MAG: dienelactone hydrolase family protein [Acidimicrobiia bacterium]|nr:dienelactone hydrolase family protein [Acidimicrobiia bacterium]